MPLNDSRVEPALAGDDGVGPADRLGQARVLGDQFEPRHQPGAQRGQGAAEPTRRAGAVDGATVDAVALPVAVREAVEPGGELRDLLRRRALLRPEDDGGVEEPRPDVAGDEYLGAAVPAVERGVGVEFLDRGEAAVGGRRPAQADDHPAGTPGDRGGDELAGAAGGGPHGVVALGATGQDQPRRQGALHDGHAVVAQAPLRVDAAAQGPGDGGAPVGAAERVERSLAAVGQGELHARPPDRVGGGGDTGRDLPRGGRASELVGCGEDRAHRESMPLRSARAVMKDASEFVPEWSARRNPVAPDMDLFSPVALGDLELANRVVMAPADPACAPAPPASPVTWSSSTTAQRAGVGLIITEGTYPNAESRAYPGQPGIVTTSRQAGWRRVAEAVHARGGSIVMQVMHGGRVSHTDITGTDRIVAPSRHRDRGRGAHPERQAALPGAARADHRGGAGDPGRHRRRGSSGRRRRAGRRGDPQRQRLPAARVPLAQHQPAHRSSTAARRRTGRASSSR